jgi:hypothetical protein
VRTGPRLLAALGAALALGACGTSSTTTLPAGLQGKSGAQIVALAKANTLAAGSVRLTQTVSEGAAKTTQVNDAGTSSGQVYFATGSGASAGSGTIRRVGSSIFLKDTGAMLDDQFGKADAAANGHWLSIPASDRNFERFSTGVLLASATALLFPTAASVVGVTTYRGRAALEVTGGLNRSAQGITGHGTMLLSLSAPYRPIVITYHVTVNTHAATLRAVFSNWGERVPSTAPAGAVPIASTGVEGN